ncbi:MAG TPA: sulfatase-like hydrolase/transferase, partial [Pirellulaceae bacterium]|nr:sulfatase-like hydrolase/transferase [Pirellulaceae bacterium]
MYKYVAFLVLVAVLSGRSAAADRPNILFAIADDWGKHAGAYGTPWVKTPAFDRIARDGLLFNNAYTPNAKCAPSRASILTGRNSWQLKEAGNHLCYFPPEFKGWGEALTEHGWTVGHTMKGWSPG